MRILLVDDNAGEVRALESILESLEDWHVTVTRSGEAAIERVEQEGFDIVLLDSELPEESGLDVLADMRRVAPTLPVVFLTAVGSEEVAYRALSEGASDFVPKDADHLSRLPARLQEIIEAYAGLETVLVKPLTSPSTPSTRSASELQDAFQGFVDGDHVQGVFLLDLAGQVAYHQVPPDVDLERLPRLLAKLGRSSRAVARHTGMTPAGFTHFMKDRERLLVVGAAHHGVVVGLLLPPETPSRLSMMHLNEAARRVRDALSQA